MTGTPAGHRRAQLVCVGHLLCVTPLLRWLIISYAIPAAPTDRRRCAHCAARLWPGACTPSARCPDCRTRVGPPPYTVEIAAAAAAVLLTGSGLRGWELAAYTTWSMLLIALGFIDTAVHRLPHQLTAAATISLIAFLALAGGNPSIWLAATASAVGLAAFHALLHTAAPSGLGLGDVTVTIPVGLALGWLNWRYAVTAVFLAHITPLLAFALRRSSDGQLHDQPFGTYLATVSILLAAAAHATR
jgi:leader peptidase (prepilin peptidase)/N-methyltransferase